MRGGEGARHAACYPNGGVQIAPSPGTLSEYLRSLLSMATRRLPTPAERGYDQAALHRLYLGSTSVKVACMVKVEWQALRATR